MLKFEDEAELIRSLPKRIYKTSGRSMKRWGEHMIPTVDDVNELNAYSYQSIIAQATHGQAISYGYDVEKYSDNFIPNPSVAEKPRLKLEKIKLIRSPKIKLRKIKPTRAQRKMIRVCMANGLDYDNACKLAMELI